MNFLFLVSAKKPGLEKAFKKQALLCLWVKHSWKCFLQYCSQPGNVLTYSNHYEIITSWKEPPGNCLVSKSDNPIRCYKTGFVRIIPLKLLSRKATWSDLKLSCGLRFRFDLYCWNWKLPLYQLLLYWKSVVWERLVNAKPNFILPPF